MQNNYNLSTGFVSIEELEEASNDIGVAGAFTTIACAAIGLSIAILTVAACPTESGACTGYCR
ncbi:hypothetical protein J2Z44_001761 [Clostridium punense]|uniref:Class IIb bacteriocin, lactobin A/cerein 7B family n=1 Tax=Clostridium punense TaxID=1054297 RepID=A0ABS4K2G8_9CLOT|nr:MULTISPECIES: hypothetical protein [Clostridium]EQB90213.1 hypothetical protein M918_01660 [Clostridium sp. BL8]MBP2021965.1 hypothetical protein [Clostridium punense]